MATVKKCRNCGSEDKSRIIYECKNCKFRGCVHVGWVSDSGCWTKKECPSCQSTQGSNKVANITGVDSN